MAHRRWLNSAANRYLELSSEGFFLRLNLHATRAKTARRAMPLIIVMDNPLIQASCGLLPVKRGMNMGTRF